MADGLNGDRRSGFGDEGVSGIVVVVDGDVEPDPAGSGLPRQVPVVTGMPLGCSHK